MKKIISLIILLFALQYLNAQVKGEDGVLRIEKDTFVLKQDLHLAAKAQFYFEWGDKEYMELAPNGLIYQMKRGLEDGLYVATFDKIKDFGQPIKDTALVTTMKGGKIQGLLQRWYNGRLEEECQYNNGLMDGVRKLYFYDEEGNKYTNIELYEKGLSAKTLQIEW